MALFLGRRNLEERFLWIVRIDSGITRKPKSALAPIIFLFILFADTHGTASIRTTCREYKTNFLDRPPHQIMAWVGLERYGYLEEAQRLAYRFLYMFVILNSISDFRLTFLF